MPRKRAKFSHPVQKRLESVTFIGKDKQGRKRKVTFKRRPRRVTL